MNGSMAFLDYQQRFRALAPLLHVALDSNSPMLATAAAKGAIVLAAAAIERFMNDVLREACESVRVGDYAALSDGQQSFLCVQIARKVRAFDVHDGGVKAFTPEKRQRLRQAVIDCAKAFEDPSSWIYLSDFGMFMDGAGAPEKINAVLRDFDPERRSFFDTLETRAGGKIVFIRALAELVDARHNAAHAKSATDPSPRDAQGWIVSSYWLVRAIERHVRTLVGSEKRAEKGA